MNKKILWTLALIAGSSLALGGVGFAQQSAPKNPPASSQMYQSGAQLTTDAAILSEIQSRMSQDTTLSNSKIQVFSDAGNVTLNGFVPNIQAENQAVNIANQVAGVKSVRDYLVVTPEMQGQAQYPAGAQQQTQNQPSAQPQYAAPAPKESFAPLAGAGPYAPATGYDSWGANLIGAKMVNKESEELGRVGAVTVGPGAYAANTQESRINFLIVEPSLPNMSDQLVAVPFRSNFDYMPSMGTITVDITKDQFANAPTIDRNAWPSGVPGRWATDSYRYFGQTPEFK